MSVLAYFLYAGVIDRLEEAIAVIEEVCSPAAELTNKLIVHNERLVDELYERLLVFVEQASALLK